MICNFCKTELAEDVKFCPECGKSPYGKQVSIGLLITGWIFTILGGLIGIIISSSIAGPKYNEESRQKGKTMRVVAIICTVVWIIINIASRS
ncbi:MAG: hypothetical protein KAT14_07220 [Candidatus Marinimicrobia bacterium]|nr:hypothetical protein [Candidatus Neomarinimicrobiota bacterium]